jgi:peptidoglycan-associated lipoprotein
MNIMQLRKLVAVSSITVILGACASEKPKEAAAPTPTPAPIVQSKPSQPPKPVAQPVAQKPVAVNPLNDPSNILSKRSVYYEFDKYAVTPEYRPIVEAHAAYIKAHPAASVVIEGNCDERGSREYNLALGQRRSEAVKSMMVMAGTPERQIESVSFGEEKPKALGHDEDAWAQNRRSDVQYRRSE